MKGFNRENGGAGSLDMLLDTMCNTFGGICFIALLISILSAMLPKSQAESSDADIRRMAENERVKQLVRERDELGQSIQLQEDMIQTYSSNSVVSLTVDSFSLSMTDKSKEMEKLRNERKELEVKIKQCATDVLYNQKEYDRLQQLLHELEEKESHLLEGRNRLVRTPHERNLYGWSPEDIWLSGGRVYCLWNSYHVCEEVDQIHDQRIVSKRPGAGVLVSEDFLSNPLFLDIVGRVRGQEFLRIFVDRHSFSELCLIRDELIRRGVLYNWIFVDDDRLYFVTGVDTKVQ